MPPKPERAAAKPRLLDLFCGAGGAAMGYHRAGFEIVGVDIEPQPNYPFEFIQADALWFMERMVYPDWAFNRHLADFDAIHASPPCQRWSAKTRDKGRHPDLITPLRPLLEDTGLPYVIENVEGAPLLDPITLCGSMFGLRVRRHRLFETNGPIHSRSSCDHAWQDADKRFLLYDHGKWFRSGIVHVFGTGGGKAREWWPSAMGCGDTWDDCWMSRPELAEAIPPAYTEFIGKQLLAWVRDLQEVAA